MPSEIKGNFLFRFAVIADSHLNPADADNTSPWHTNHMANPRNEVVVDAINALRPAFTVHVGDVVHPLPTTAHYEGASEYALALYRRLTMPFYIAPGNHDIGDKWQPGTPAASINDDTCAAYEGKFGLQWQAFDRDDCHFVILNACLFGSGMQQEALQWQFLEETLAANQGKRHFVFSHYPPYITTAQEADNYDNIDAAPRARLLALLQEHDVEALFAGHVHNFFLNRFGRMWSYALPSSTNFRQDYAELFRTGPAEELGRNDLGKFGFFLVDIHEQGHVARFVRTQGSTSTDDVERIVAQVGGDIRSNRRPTVGVDLTHDWTAPTRLPFNPPLDTFMRKEARNDYYILNLWDCAIRSIRIPAHDLLEPAAFERVQMLADLGHRVTVFHVNAPSPALLQAAATLGTSVQGMELICTREQMQACASSIDNGAAYPVYYAPIFQIAEQQGRDTPFDHTMASGVALNDLPMLAQDQSMRSLLGKRAGIVLRIAYAEPVLEALARIANFCRENPIPVAVHVKLAPDESYVVNDDDGQQALRVAEASLGALLYPDIAISVDTFMDIDRGYFARHGLVDRRHNLRPAGGAARAIHQQLQRLRNLNLQAIDRQAGQTSIRLSAEGAQYTLSIDHASSASWNTHAAVVHLHADHLQIQGV